MAENQSPQQFSHQLWNADCLIVAVKVPGLSNQKPPQLFTTCDQSHNYGKQLYKILFNALPFPQSLPAFYTVGSLETSSKPSPSWHIHDEQLQLLRHWVQLPWAVPLK